MPKTRKPSRSKPLVSIVIVSYNTCELTLRSIKHVLQSKNFSAGDLEIILVDNNSKDQTVNQVKKKFPRTVVIANNDNRGFGGGNNQGIRIAKGKYILLLNTDAFLSPDALFGMVKLMEDDPEITSVGPQLRYNDGSLQLSGGYLPTPLRVMTWVWGIDAILGRIPYLSERIPMYHMRSLAWHTRERHPEWLMGACVLFRRKDLLESGAFDEKIFMYAEEVELYRRLKAAGKDKIIFTPEFSVIHLGSASTKKANARRLVLELKGIEYIYKKHYPYLLPLVRFMIYVGVILRLVIFQFIPWKKEALAEYKTFFSKV